jgi:hypothetical protein
LSKDIKLPRVDRVKDTSNPTKMKAFVEDVIRALEKVQIELQRLENTKQDA